MKFKENHVKNVASPATHFKQHFRLSGITVEESKPKSKATSVIKALKKFQEQTGRNPSDQKEINLCFQWPPIMKLDESLSFIPMCEVLSLSSNMIDKIEYMNPLKHLKILSIGRNLIQNISGLEVLGDTLEELWISYNLIQKLSGVGQLKALRVLYMGHNMVQEWSEFMKLQDIPFLEELVFTGNPLTDNLGDEEWRADATKALPGLVSLDGEAVLGKEDLEKEI